MKKIHKLTALVVGSQDELIHQSALALIRSNLDFFLSRTVSYLNSNASSANWSLRVISGNSNDLDAVCRDVCDSNRIPYDLLCLNASATNIVGAEKVVIYPLCDGSSAATRKKMRATRDELGICFSDLVVLLTNANFHDDEDLDLLEVAKDSLLFGRLVVFLDASATFRVLDPRGIPIPDLTVLSQGSLDHKFIKSYTKILSYDSVSSVLEQLDLFSHDHHAELQKVLPEGQLRKFSGRLDAVLTAIYSGFQWAEIKRGVKKNPFNEYYGVSVEELPGQYGSEHPIAEPDSLRRAFANFDIAANFFSGLYRDINWVVYALSAFAVFSAIAGAIALAGSSLIWAIAEVFAISLIIFLVMFAKKYDVHEQWLSNRFRAESIRYSRVCLPFLLAPSTMKYVPSNANDHEDEETLDDLKLVRRLMIDSGISRPKNNDSYIPSGHFEQLRSYALHILEGQMKFHKRTAHRNHHIAHNLHRLSLICFALTGVAIIGHFLVHSDYWLLFTAALPALAGAIHGLVTQNEFERIGQISIVTYEQLLATRSALENNDRWNDLDDAQRFLRMQWLIKDAIDVMAGSARSWQDIVVGRATTLPA